MARKPKELGYIPIASTFKYKRVYLNYGDVITEDFYRNFDLFEREVTIFELNNPNHPISKQRQLVDFVKAELLKNACANVEKEAKQAVASSKGGKSNAVLKQESLKARNQSIKSAARELLESGRAKHEIAGILADRFNLSDKQIRNILK